MHRRAFLTAAAASSLAPAAFARDGLTGAEIVRRAHAAAGGATWLRPGSLTLIGRGTFFPGGVEAARLQIPDYRMWRVFPRQSTDAHAANGMVRIEAKRADGSPFIRVAFDGVDTYDADGKVEGAAAGREWSENFGFGIVRYALDPGFTIDRLPDDEIEGRAAHVVRVNDPSGGKTLFGITRDDHQIVWLGFSTPRGWHERRYSRFYRKPGVDFVQPGLVRLYYDGVQQNAIEWTDYRIGEDLPVSFFRLP